MEVLEKISFTDLYLAVREKEGRIYSDEEVRRLPDCNRHREEWKIRKETAKTLRNYVQSRIKNQKSKILEVGCGNGWLTNYLGATGYDINEVELEQAKRVFPEREFLCALSGKTYDAVVFAASIQYFQNLSIIEKALEMGEEVHIVDSCFYPSHLTAEAALRSRAYYESLGFPEMAQYYFHHSLEDLKPFNYKILKEKKPFYWIKITK